MMEYRSLFSPWVYPTRECSSSSSNGCTTISWSCQHDLNLLPFVNRDQIMWQFHLLLVAQETLILNKNPKSHFYAYFLIWVFFVKSLKRYIYMWSSCLGFLLIWVSVTSFFWSTLILVFWMWGFLVLNLREENVSLMSWLGFWVTGSFCVSMPFEYFKIPHCALGLSHAVLFLLIHEVCISYSMYMMCWFLYLIV